MSDNELSTLGAQQRKVMEIIWAKDGATVQEVLDDLNAHSGSMPLAYTTVLATMQKLEKSGWLTHERREELGRAYIYQAMRDRNEAIGDSLCSLAKTFLDGNKTWLLSSISM